jgi:hypothetical protein
VRINRLALGLIAGPVAIIAAVALGYLEVQVFGLLHWKLIGLFGAGAGMAVFWLADKLGVLAEPSAHTSLLFSDDNAEAKPVGEDPRPIVPK